MKYDATSKTWVLPKIDTQAIFTAMLNSGSFAILIISVNRASHSFESSALPLFLSQEVVCSRLLRVPLCSLQ